MQRLVRFENKKKSSTVKNDLACYNVGVVVVKVVGLTPGENNPIQEFNFNSSTATVFSTE
jgi:hypothetical protein